MEPFMTVADMFSRDSLHGLANTTDPDRERCFAVAQPDEPIK